MNQEIFHIVAGVATCLAMFWTLIQIIEHIREKQSKNLKIAVILIIITAGGYVALQYYFPTRARKNNNLSHNSTRSVSEARTISGTPLGASSKTGVIISTSPSSVKDEGSSIDASTFESDEGGKSSPADSPQEACDSSGAASPPTLEESRAASLKSSFLIEIRRNLLGGISEIVAPCTFAEVGGTDIELVSYSITISFIEHQDDLPEDRTVTKDFERTLKERICIKADSTCQKVITFDKDIGDLLLKYEKSGKPGWVKIIWTGKDAAGNMIASESISNRE